MVTTASPAAAAGQATSGQAVAQLEVRVAELEEAFAELRAGYADRLVALENQVVGLQADLATQALLAETAAAAAQPAEPEATDLEAAVAQALAEIGAEETAAGAGAGAAPTGATAPDDRRFDDRSRNLSGMNPEVSVTGDMFGSVSDQSGDPSTDGFRINEFEMAFQHGRLLKDQVNRGVLFQLSRTIPNLLYNTVTKNPFLNKVLVSMLDFLGTNVLKQHIPQDALKETYALSEGSGPAVTSRQNGSANQRMV